MFEQYDIHIISLLILVVVLLNTIKNGGENMARQRLFRSLIICDMLLIAVNAVMLILTNNKDNTVTPYVHTVLLFLIVLFCELWAAFCTYRSGRRIKVRGLFVLSLPLIVTAVLLVLNLSNEMIFAHNNERGPFFHSISAAVIFYIVYSFIITWRCRKNMDQREYYPYIVGPVLLSALGMVKLFWPFEDPVMWPAVAIGLLVLQLFALDEKMNLDHLTGLHNRKYLDAYIEDLISVYKNVQDDNGNFAALMLDIDNFKTINDTYGHVQGDKVLVSAAKLLKKSVRRGDFVARYGGDEFMIVLDRCGQQIPERVMRRLKENVNLYNAENKLPYELSFSVGCKIFTNVKGLTAKDIFKTIDELMYVHKQNKAAATSKYKGIQK